MVIPTAAAPPSYEEIRRAPKALLHDHLDGGLRPATIMELADEVGLGLPATDVPELATWFATAASSGSLEAIRFSSCVTSRSFARSSSR